MRGSRTFAGDNTQKLLLIHFHQFCKRKGICCQNDWFLSQINFVLIFPENFQKETGDAAYIVDSFLYSRIVQPGKSTLHLISCGLHCISSSHLFPCDHTLYRTEKAARAQKLCLLQDLVCSIFPIHFHNSIQRLGFHIQFRISCVHLLF